MLERFGKGAEQLLWKNEQESGEKQAKTCEVLGSSSWTRLRCTRKGARHLTPGMRPTFKERTISFRLANEA